MGSMRTKTATFSTTVIPAIRAKAAAIPSRSPSMSRWPKRMAKTVPLPMHSPKRMEVRKVISVNAEPTAPKALEPRNWPTMRVSAML